MQTQVTKKTKLLLFLPLIFFLFLSLVSSVAYAKKNNENTEQKTSISVTLEVPSYSIEQDESGDSQFTIDSFYLSGFPGDPLLPQKIYNIALPPNIDVESLKLDIQVLEEEELEGTYQIAPAPPATTWVDDEQIFAWGENADSIVDGKNILVYENDAYFPDAYAEIVTYSQMRKWEFVKLNYSPVKYNPSTGKVQIATKIKATISYDMGLVANGISHNDTAMDDVAEDILYNYENASEWYKPEIGVQSVSGKKGYVIITTNDIVSGSTKLSDFVTHKESYGYTVSIVTEAQYGSLTGQSPNGTAEKIRQWLINNYVSEDIRYALLIGDPDPDDPSSGSDTIGDIPMKMLWPRNSETSYKESPSDYFYADLTGNWDLDGDGYFGEYSGDRGTGGVDFSPEVYVGRIPVYTSGYASLDSILQKTITYETAFPLSIGWRKSALLPMSYSDASTDGAYLAEAMKDDYLNDEGYSSWTMYQQGSLCSAANSSFANNEELHGSTAVSDRWSANNYGIVNWWAHGSEIAAWSGYSECGWEYLFRNSQADNLDDAHPSFVYQNSCTNGYPENANNLGYSILKNGGIGTVSASRVSWYMVGQWAPQTGYADNAAIGYYWHGELIANKRPAGEALFLTKSYMGHWWGGASWMNLFDFNLYGDPSTGITSTQSNDYIQFATGVNTVDYTNSINTEHATSSPTDPDLPPECSIEGSGEGTVWYKYELTSVDAISIDTFGSEENYDTFIAVWKQNGPELDDLLFVACNDDASSNTNKSAVAIRVTSGTYYIEIGQP